MWNLYYVKSKIKFNSILRGKNIILTFEVKNTNGDSLIYNKKEKANLEN